jgi:hypothetical protein
MTIIFNNPKIRFAEALRKHMADAGLTRDELAHKMWGETVDLDGHRVAKNRDLIFLYLYAQRYPEPLIMERLAVALGVTVQELAPDDKPPEAS